MLQEKEGEAHGEEPGKVIEDFVIQEQSKLIFYIINSC